MKNLAWIVIGLFLTLFITIAAAEHRFDAGWLNAAGWSYLYATKGE